MTAVVVFALLAQTPAQEPTSPPPYASLIQEVLVAATPGWLVKHTRDLRTRNKGAGRVVLEIHVGPDGAVIADELVLTSKSNTMDNLARWLVLESEPFPAPDPGTLSAAGQRHIECVLRVVFGQKRRRPTLEVATACQRNDSPVFHVAGMSPKLSAAKDPSARLLTGWTKELDGNLEEAARLYRQAVRGAPAWDLAARARGLALVREKKVPQAIPYLNTYVEARKGAADALGFAREIERYKKVQAARIAELNRVRDRLSKADIALGIKKGYPLLEPCLKEARRAGRLAVGVDKLLLTWTIRKDGSAHSARLDGPEQLAMTDYADCIEQAITTWRFPRYSAGSEVTVGRVPIKVRGSRPASRPTSSSASEPAGQEPDEPLDDPTFSQCERTPEEIQGHIRGRYARIQACIMAERHRAPAAPMPEELPITLVFDSEGPVRSIAVDHRAYRTGRLATCVSKALTGSLLPSNGADCPAQFAVDLRRLKPRRR